MSHRHTRTPLLAVAALASLLAFVAPDARAQAVAGATALDRLGGLYGAAVALDGELAVVGAPTESPGGAAYVYRSGADGWQLEARLEAPDAATGAFFGGAVAVDGERVAVGAWGAERAYLFRHAASGWALEASLSSSGAGTGTRFGAALALAGERLAVAATSQGRPPERAGAVHLYRLEGDAWRAWEQLAPDGLPSGARFGSSLALQGDLLAVGADGDSPTLSEADAAAADPGAALATGAVYLYRLGSEPQQVARLTPPPGGAAPAYGASLALADGLLAVGAPGGDYGGARSGPVFVYREAGSEWVLAARLGVEEGPSERFGPALALVGRTVVAALVTDNDLPEGDVRVVAFAPEGDAWQAVPAVLHADRVAGVRYARLASDGRRLLIGATVPDGAEAGSAWVVDGLPAPATAP